MKSNSPLNPLAGDDKNGYDWIREDQTRRSEFCAMMAVRVSGKELFDAMNLFYGTDIEERLQTKIVHALPYCVALIAGR